MAPCCQHGPDWVVRTSLWGLAETTIQLPVQTFLRLGPGRSQPSLNDLPSMSSD